ncbi:pentapeptide repeat-containing protein [Actinosynnema sp. CS-041913]|uniref:pentapeptide repeat-containing protein n=1 Tax=Actinosynnema sp. CS-041913 TaxID=3239917 RepID=UPI003D902DC3
MASSEALDCLRSGGAAWSDYRTTTPGRIDLTFADLKECDLQRREFRDCDFTGALLDHSDFDGSSFSSCDFSGASVMNASLVGITMEDCTFRHSNLSKAIFRHCTLRDIVMSDTKLDTVLFERCGLTGSTMLDVQVDNCLIEACKVVTSRFIRWRGTGSRILDCNFQDCTIEHIDLSRASLKGVHTVSSTISFLTVAGSVRSNRFQDCRITTLSFRSDDVGQLDFSGSRLADTDMECVGMRSATLTDVSAVNCRWPRQRGCVTWAGRYVPSSTLLGHPVQDVKGLTPVLRREIADAQFLEYKVRTVGSLGGRILLRLWGITSAYGQSLTRLGVCSALVIIAHSIALLFTRNLFAWQLDALGALWSITRATAMTFLALGPPMPPDAGVADQAINTSIRLIGFLSLGLWIGVAAQKLGRLSRD